MVREELYEVVSFSDHVSSEKVGVFFPVPEWMMSVEVSAPEHVFILSLPEVVHVVM